MKTKEAGCQQPRMEKVNFITGIKIKYAYKWLKIIP